MFLILFLNLTTSCVNDKLLGKLRFTEKIILQIFKFRKPLSTEGQLTHHVH